MVCAYVETTGGHADMLADNRQGHDSRVMASLTNVQDLSSDAAYYSHTHQPLLVMQDQETYV